ncbi:MAG: MobF family relaxase, partial [Sciscionella sp.]
LLDELVDTGALSAADRARLAAEDSGPTLTRLLRRAELAGHDPRQALTDAVTDRPLTGARSITYVLHHRITGATDLAPHGDTYSDWTPQVADPAWQRRLAVLATAADERRQQLGHQTVTDPPKWAIDALGPPPEDGDERRAWQDRAATVAAHRELTGHADPTEALGSAPTAGQAEAYASWRAAWQALGRPEAGREELELSDGQLRVRIRAHQREEAWAPRYVANELAGTRQAA